MIFVTRMWGFVFQRCLCIVWIHNDSMNIRFGGKRKYKDLEQV